MTDNVQVSALNKTNNKWLDVWNEFKNHKGALAGAIIFALIVILVLLGPFVWPFEANGINIRIRNQGPSLAHPLGTDQLGRDTLARIMAGGRTSITVGLTAMLLSLFLGTLIGVVAGYFKKLDSALMRFTDLFLSLPLLPLLLVMMLLFREPLSTSFGPEKGMFILIVVSIGITSWMPTARIVRGDVLAIKEREFILAARSIVVLTPKLFSDISFQMCFLRLWFLPHWELQML